MDDVIDDEFHGVGGSYVIRDGKRVRVEETIDDPRGNRPRDAAGNPLDTTPEPLSE